MSRLQIGLVSAFVITAFLFFPPSARPLPGKQVAAPSFTFKINGNVYYEDRSHPAAHVQVQVQDSEGVSFQTEETNDSGWFEFARVNSGSYTLEVNVQGYQRVSMPVDPPGKGLVIELISTSNEKKPTATGAVSAHELSMPAKARDLMTSGKTKLYAEKNAEGGLADFQSAIAIAPGYYEAYYQAGMAYLTMSKRDNAETSFRKSVDLSGDKYCEADVGLGTLMLDRNEFAQGEKIIRHGVELNPAYWMGHYELARALLNEDKLPDALKSADQAKSLAPGAAIVYRLLSNIHMHQKDYPALLTDLDAYIELDPDSPSGIRAKQLREQVDLELRTEKATPAAETKP
jgi:hypothetical protein